MFRVALHWQIVIGMVIGAATGLALNLTVSHRHTLVTEKEALPRGIARFESRDTPDRIEIGITPEEGERREWVVEGTRRTQGAVPTLDSLAEKDPRAHNLFQQHGRSWARWVGDGGQRLGMLFLRLLRMVAIPLIVTSLMTGVLGLGHASRLGRMFGRTLGYYLTTSTLAIITGLVMVNLIRPGLQQPGVAPPAEAEELEVADSLGGILFEQLETMIPPNPFAALAEANFLSIICFTLAFAIFTILVGGRPYEVIRDFFSAGFDVMMAMTLAIIKLAPLGVMFLMLYVTATQGIDVFRALAWYMLAVLCALGFHATVTLPLLLWFVAGRNPLEYVKAMSPALLTAFSSASSNGTLPLTLANVEQRAGVSNRVGSFVLPLGATINMDGTALYEAVAVLFIAQMHFGHSLELTQQILVAVTALLASIGAAGIPHAGLVMMVIILQAVGLPLELQGIILAVDRILDMFRTSVNVWSDSCGCAVVARMEASGGHGEVETERSMEFQP